MSDEAFFRELTAELEARGRLALATVVETRGSGPSRIGRRFLIFADGSFQGTIGGGPFEALVVADAAALFREDGPLRFLKWYDFFEREIESGELREPTNMICGGSARVSVELLKAASSGAGTLAWRLLVSDSCLATMFSSATTAQSTRGPTGFLRA